MNRKRNKRLKRGNSSKRKKRLPWCWYCKREFHTERILRNHQRSRHFKCVFCNKKKLCGPELTKHMAEVHEWTLSKIPNALPCSGRPDIYIIGTSGIPAGSWESKQPHQQRENTTSGAISYWKESGRILYVSVENLASLFKCLNCFNYVLPPILQCRNGHFCCNTCYSTMDLCAICREVKGDIKNIVMEKMATKVFFPCKYVTAGCSQQLMLTEMMNHEECCKFRMVMSPKKNVAVPPLFRLTVEYDICGANQSNIDNEEGFNPLNVLASFFECAVCSHYILEPILQCENGHVFCTDCHNMQTSCPTCNDILDQRIRNFFLEKVATSLLFHCKYSISGCKQQLMLQEKADHEALCEFSIRTLLESDDESEPLWFLRPSVPPQERNLLDIPGAVMKKTDRPEIIVHPDEDMSLEEKRAQLPKYNMPFQMSMSGNFFSGLNAYAGRFSHPSMTCPTMMNASAPYTFVPSFMNATPWRPFSIPLNAFPFSSVQASAAGSFSPMPSQFPFTGNFMPFASNHPAARNFMPFASNHPSC